MTKPILSKKPQIIPIILNKDYVIQQNSIALNVMCILFLICFFYFLHTLYIERFDEQCPF